MPATKAREEMLIEFFIINMNYQNLSLKIIYKTFTKTTLKIVVQFHNQQN